MSLDLSIDITKEGDVTILSVSGELDDFHAPKLNEAFKHVIDAESCTRMVLELEKATFIDSVGLGTIAIAGKKMMAHQGTVRLVTTQPQIIKIINTSGILDALKESISMHLTKEQALDAFK